VAAAAEPAAAEPEPEPAAESGQSIQMGRAPAQSAAPEGTPQFSTQQLDAFAEAIDEGKATHLTDDEFFAAMAHKNKDNLDTIAYNFKLQSKLFEKKSKKSEKKKRDAMAACKQSITESNHKKAVGQAQEAIRHKEEALTYLKWSSKLDGMAGKFALLGKQGQVLNNMKKINEIMRKELEELPTGRVEEGAQQFAAQISDEVAMGQKMDTTLKGAAQGGDADADAVAELVREAEEMVRLETASR